MILLSVLNLCGNRALLALIENKLQTHVYPQISLLSGPMGVGKTTTANYIATQITEDASDVHLFNFGENQNLTEIENAFFKNSPVIPIVLIFDEFQYLTKEQQRVFPTMLDTIPNNVYVIMTTTEKKSILKPIVSRAQVFEFRHLNNNEMNDLLTEYLMTTYNTSCSKDIASILLKRSNGIPRDLIKYIDLLFSSNATDEDMLEILGSITDNKVFFLISALKTDTIGLHALLQEFGSSYDTFMIQEIKDFWTRFLLARLDNTGNIMDNSIVSTLKELYNFSEIILISKTLTNLNQDNFLLEILQLNLHLTNVRDKAVVGKQIAQRTSTSSIVPETHNDSNSSKENRKLSVNSIRNMNLS